MSAPAKTPTDNRPFVLFADDDTDTLALFQILGEQEGWRVDTATTAREIIDKVNYHCGEVGQCYDCIVSDVNFIGPHTGPKFTGITAIGEIRKRWSHVPVIFYSAYLNSVLRDQITELGNAEPIEKLGRTAFKQEHPMTVQDVIIRVKRVIRWRIQGQQGRPERRKENVPGHPRRRENDCREEVRIPKALEEVISSARAIRDEEVANGKANGE